MLNKEYNDLIEESNKLSNFVEEYIYNNDDNLSAPVNLFKIAEKFNIKVFSAIINKDEATSGINFNTNNPDILANIYIAKNSYKSSNRNRFILAHSIAHCLFHKNKYKDTGMTEYIKDDDFFRSNLSIEEIQANEIALNILMPKLILIKDWNKYGSTESLAFLYKVPISIMSYRLFSLGLKRDW